MKIGNLIKEIYEVARYKGPSEKVELMTPAERNFASAKLKTILNPLQIKQNIIAAGLMDRHMDRHTPQRQIERMAAEVQRKYRIALKNSLDEDEMEKAGIFEADIAGGWGTGVDAWYGYGGSTVFPDSLAQNISTPLGYGKQLRCHRAIYDEPRKTRDDELVSLITTLMDFRNNAIKGSKLQLLPQVNLFQNNIEAQLGIELNKEIATLNSIASMSGDNGFHHRLMEARDVMLQKHLKKIQPSIKSDILDSVEITNEWMKLVNSPEFFEAKNAGDVDITPGFKGIRDENLRQYQESLIVCEMEIGEMEIKGTKILAPKKIHFKDQIMFEPCNRYTGERLIEGESYRFGDVGWKYRDKYDKSGKGLMLQSGGIKRYIIRKINCPNRKLWPVPFLIRRNMWAAMQYYNALKNSDIKMAKSLRRQFNLITAPSPELFKYNWTIDQAIKWVDDTAQQFQDINSDNMDRVDLYGVDVKSIQPKVDSLGNEKYIPVNEMIMAGNGMPMIQFEDGEKSRSIVNGKVFMSEILNESEDEINFYQLGMIRWMYQNNKKFESLTEPELWGTPNPIWESQAGLELRRKMYEMGSIPDNVMLLCQGMSPSAIQALRIIEENAGINESIKKGAKVVFKQEAGVSEASDLKI